MFALAGDEIVQNLRCTACSLSENPDLNTNCMNGVGSSTPTYLFVGVNPGVEDDKIGRPNKGKHGDLFLELLRDAGFSANDMRFTNATRCASFGVEVQKRQWQACKHHLQREIAKYKPEVVVAVGAKTVEWLTGQSGVGRLNRVRLSLEWDESIPVYSIRQPMALTHVYGDERRNLRSSMVSDLNWLKQQVRHGMHKRRWEDNCDYQTAKTIDDLERFFAEIEAQPVLSVDLETVKPDFSDGSLDHTTGKIQAIGFSWGKGIGRAIPIYARGTTSYLWWADGVVENYIIPRVQKILREKTIFGQNFIQFDQKWTRSHFGVELCKIDFDTQFAHYIINPEMPHDLESMAMELLGCPPWKKELSATDTVRTCTYLCKDVDNAWQVREVLEKRLEPHQKWLLTQLMIPLAYELMEMEYRGIRIDDVAMQKLDDQLVRKISEAEATFRSFEQVRAFELAHGCRLNTESSDQLRVLFKDYFRLAQVSTTDSGEYSTDKEWQEHHKDHPAVAALTNSRRLAKLKGTYVDGMRQRLRNQRAHTSFLAHRTATGRLASRDPNLQNIPRDDTAGKVLDDGKDIKKIFVPDDGYVLLQGDLSQAELRVLASVSKDPNLIQIYLDKLDAHRATAAKVFGKSLDMVTKAERTLAKAINFGVIYGKTKETLIQDFLVAGSTQREAEEFYTGHQQTFPYVWAWMAEQERIIRAMRKQVTFFGRTRHYQYVDEAAIRQAYNFPIQSLASDITEIGIIRFAHELRVRNLDACILLTVHDSIIVQCRIDLMWEVAQLLYDTMTGVQWPWMRVPMDVDIEAGFSWGAMKGIDIVNKTLAA